MVRRARHWEGRSGELIGRSHEIDEIEAALERLTAGRPWLLCAVGEPGIGKSRVLAELAWRAERRGYLVLVGRAAEFEQDLPFGLIVEALNKHLGALEPAAFGSLDQPSAGELASIFPALAHLGTSVSTGRPAGDRHWAQYAIRGMLERLASWQPVVLVLDDVHWADGASVEVIAHISRRFRGPLLVALAFRQAPARLASALSTAERGGFGTRLEPPPLTSREASELIGPGFDGRTQEILYRESGGNPFYLEQLARFGDPRELRATLSKEHASAAGALPVAVATAIREELANIGEDARIVLDAAAVAGESFEPELIGAIADRPLPFDALDELLAADLIRPTTVPRRFRFRHPIVRRAVYDEMRRGWQVSAHARAASALAAAGAPPTARAHHVERSANQGDEEAITLLADAARGAAPRAPLTTGHWLRGAVSLLADDGASERRISLLTEAAAAFAAAGAYEDALGSYEEALALVPDDRPDQRADLAVQVAELKQHGVRRFESQALLKRALEPLAPDSSSALAIRLELAHDHFWRGEFAPMRELAAHVATAGDRTRPITILAITLTSLADFYLGRIEDSSRELVSAEQALAALPDDLLASRMDLPSQISLAACRLERFPEARGHVSRGRRVSRERGQNSTLPTLLRVEATVSLMTGQLGKAMTAAEDATEAALLSGNDRLAMWALEAAALAAYWAGDAERALSNSTEALACAKRTAEPYFSALGRLQHAGARLASGQATDARDELIALDTPHTQRLLDLWGAHGWTLLTEAYLAHGELNQARDAAARAQVRAEAAPLPQQLAGARYATGLVMRAAGDARAAVAAGRDATARFERAGNPLFAARARVLTGAALGIAGQRQVAVDELERAEALLTASGAANAAAAAARELRRLGRRVPRRKEANAPSGLDTLSAREREVAQHVTSGETNRQVAAALFLSEKTIEKHLARIYGKLGVHSRAALAALIAGERRSSSGAQTR